MKAKHHSQKSRPTKDLQVAAKWSATYSPEPNIQQKSGMLLPWLKTSTLRVPILESYKTPFGDCLGIGMKFAPMKSSPAHTIKFLGTWPLNDWVRKHTLSHERTHGDPKVPQNQRNRDARTVGSHHSAVNRNSGKLLAQNRTYRRQVRNSHNHK